jgi:hypothetical protein
MTDARDRNDHKRNPTRWAVVMPGAGEQITFMLNAPIPFFGAIFAVLVVLVPIIWAAFAWRYNAVTEKRRELYTLLTAEAQLAKEGFLRREVDLKATIEKQAEQIKDLEVQFQKVDLPVEVQASVKALSDTSTTATRQMSDLEKAGVLLFRTYPPSVHVGPARRPPAKEILDIED